jgi:hypothetical protein
MADVATRVRWGRNSPVRVIPGGPVGRTLPCGPGEREVTVAWTDDADGPETRHDTASLIYAPDMPLVYGERVHRAGSHAAGSGAVSRVGLDGAGGPWLCVTWDGDEVESGPYRPCALERDQETI